MHHLTRGVDGWLWITAQNWGLAVWSSSGAVLSSPSVDPQWRWSLLRKLWCQYCKLLLWLSRMVTSIELLSSVTYSTILPFGWFAMSHRFQRIRQFNNAELHPYPSQYNTCRKVTVRFYPLLVWCCLLCRLVVITYGKQVGAYQGNHGCLPVVTSWLTLLIGLYIWSVGVSH